MSTLLLLFVRSGPAMNDVFSNAGRIPRIDSRHADPSSPRAIGPLGEWSFFGSERPSEGPSRV